MKKAMLGFVSVVNSLGTFKLLEVKQLFFRVAKCDLCVVVCGITFLFILSFFQKI